MHKTYGTEVKEYDVTYIKLKKKYIRQQKLNIKII